MSVFKGAAVAIITPFHDDADKTINYDVFADLIDYQIEHGTDAIVVCGSTGEAATMTEEEHLAACRFVIDYVKKRVPVIAGTGSNCTRTAHSAGNGRKTCQGCAEHYRNQGSVRQHQPDCRTDDGYGW